MPLRQTEHCPDPQKNPNAYKKYLRRSQEAPLFAATPADIDAALPTEARNLATPTPTPSLSFMPTPPPSNSEKGKERMSDPSDLLGFNPPQPFASSSSQPDGAFPFPATTCSPPPPPTSSVPAENLMQQMLNKRRAEKAEQSPANGGSSSVVDDGLTDPSAQQQQQNTSTAGGLFGSSTQNTLTQPASGLSTQQSQVQQTGGLFGSSSTQNPNQNVSNITGGVFGGTNTAQQNQHSGGVFGGSNVNTQQTQNTGGLFGGNNANTQHNQNTGGLFGGNNANTLQSNSTGGLFGGGSTNTPQNQAAGGLFGRSSIAAPQNASNIFGNNTSTQQNKPSTNMFGGTGDTSILGGTASNMFSQTNMNTGSNLFGGSTLATTSMQPRQQAPSLLSATQHNQMNQAVPFGRLSMGQAAAAPTTVGAAKVDYGGLLPTTRFEDCIDSVKAELEAVDKMIQQQESFARQIEALLPKHEENINSLGPDVDFIKSKAEDVDQALATDAQGVEMQRRNAEQDVKDAQRCQRIITNLALPSQYQYPSMGVVGFNSMYGSQQRPQQAPQVGEGDEYDTDLIGNYFVPMVGELQRAMNAYANNLTEIENHMRVIEGSTVTQAQQLAQRKAGTSTNPPNGDDTVRELAATLRGFEESTLGVAGVVGECRESVNRLVLGRLSNTLGNMP